MDFVQISIHLLLLVGKMEVCQSTADQTFEGREEDKWKREIELDRKLINEYHPDLILEKEIEWEMEQREKGMLAMNQRYGIEKSRELENLKKKKLCGMTEKVPKV